MKRTHAVAVGAVTKAQIKTIYTLAQGLNMVDRLTETDLLHELVSSLSGKDHVSDLTSDEASQIIDRLKGNMRGNFRRSQKQETIPGMATAKQQALIKHLMRELVSMDSPDPSEEEVEKRLKGWIKRNAKTEDIRWLKFRQASVIIEGLKKYIARKEGELNRGGH